VPILVDCIRSGPPFGSNCYLVRPATGAAEAVGIDPGGEAAELLEALAAAQAQLAGILVTHADVDHVAAVAELASATGAEVWAPEGEAAALGAGVTRGGFEVRAHTPEHTLSDGQRLELAGLEVAVVSIPGHSSDHVAFAIEGSLFSGDLLFAGSVGRSDLEGGDESLLLASVARLLDRFGPDAAVYPGHGQPTTLGRELATNPFLAALRGG
jgi:glyoxylase-like metal-dependent hydrolase (beta-lactamase superfamily II)